MWMLLLSRPFLYAYAGIALLAGAAYALHRHDVGVRDEVHQQHLADAATAQQEAAARATKREGERDKEVSALRRKIASLRAEKASACSEVNALPGVLEALK